MAAISEAFEWAANPEAPSCRPAGLPVALLETRACPRLMQFVFNDHAKQYGWGKESGARLQFSWDTIAEANELKKDYDYKQVIDTSAVPK